MSNPEIVAADHVNPMSDASDINGYDGDCGGGDAIGNDNDMKVDGADDSDDDVLHDPQYELINPDICVNPFDMIDHDTTNHNVRSSTRSGRVYNPY